MSPKVHRKMHTQDLVAKIEKITRERMSQEQVVELSDLRNLKNRKEPLTILMVEDDETIRSALKRMFESEGYHVIAAADGTQLTQLLDDHNIDMIILDVGLPWINGYELAELMKAHKDLKNLPLIFISGRTGDDDMKRGFSVGADDFIRKPFDLEKVKKTVKTLMKLAHSK